MKDEIKETTLEDLLDIKVLQKMLRLEDRIKELEQINEEHRRINGELRKTINNAIEYMNNYNEFVVPDANIKSLILKEEYKKIIDILQGSDE